MFNAMSGSRRDRRYHEVVTWVDAQIQSGALRPGDRLPPERALVAQFGISRTAVREALQRLATRGLIESHVGRGTFVREPDALHLADALGRIEGVEQSGAAEALHVLTAALGHLAQWRIPPEALGRLREQARQADAHPDEASAFLSALGEAARNPVLGSMARAVADLIQRQNGACAWPMSFETAFERGVAARVAQQAA